MKRLLALTLALAFATPAAAQFAPTLDEDITVVDELIVRAYGGPPWWKVSDKDSTVYILASPGPLRAGTTFDQTLLERRLTGAKQVILPPVLEFGPLAVLAAPNMNRLMRDLNDSTATRLEPSLPPAVRDRFVAAREKIGRQETRYGALPPGLAGMALAGDAAALAARRSPPPRVVWVEDIVTAAAKRKRVRAAPADKFGGVMLASAFGELRSAGVSCLTSALDELERGRVRPGPTPGDLAAARAWADGDIRPMIEAARRSETPSILFSIVNEKGAMHLSLSTEACMRQLPTVMRARERNVAAQAQAIEAALRGRGHAVAVVDAPSLLMTNGVLQRLQRRGFTVQTPDRN